MAALAQPPSGSGTSGVAATRRAILTRNPRLALQPRRELPGRERACRWNGWSLRVTRMHVGFAPGSSVPKPDPARWGIVPHVARLVQVLNVG